MLGRRCVFLVFGAVIPSKVKERLKQVKCISGTEGAFAAQCVPLLLLAAQQSTAAVPRIAEEELTLEEEVGEGAFSVVWRATWRRAIAVGKQRVTETQVAVKMSNRMNKNDNNNNMNNAWLQSLTRDLAVICGLPHQNILTLHGVCESKQQQPPYVNKPQAATSPSSSSSFLWVVYELMTSDLAKLLQTAVEEQKRKQQQKQEQDQQSSSISLLHTRPRPPPPPPLLGSGYHCCCSPRMCCCEFCAMCQQGWPTCTLTEWSTET